jgi:hypothetical protein
MIGVNIAHQLHIDLDEVGLEARKELEAGKTGAEVVDRRRESVLLQQGQPVLRIR